MTKEDVIKAIVKLQVSQDTLKAQVGWIVKLLVTIGLGAVGAISQIVLKNAGVM